MGRGYSGYGLASGGARLSQAKHFAWYQVQGLLSGCRGLSATSLRNWLVAVAQWAKEKVTVRRSDGRTVEILLKQLQRRVNWPAFGIFSKSRGKSRTLLRLDRQIQPPGDGFDNPSRAYTGTKLFLPQDIEKILPLVVERLTCNFISPYLLACLSAIWTLHSDGRRDLAIPPEWGATNTTLLVEHPKPGFWSTP